MANPSPGGALLLLLACLPYAVMVAMLPVAGDFPGEGGGEARMAWGFQQLWAYVACVTTMGLLGLAMWRAARAGGIAGWARQVVALLVPAAAVAMLVAISEGFEQPGPWLRLVPILLPPVIGAYALWGCVPALSRWLTRIDGAAVGAIAAVSLAVIPLWVLDTASYPGRLERHRAELAAADAAARVAGAQREAELRARFARLGPESSLREYIAAQNWYLTGIDIPAGARAVKSRQGDAVAMLDEGMILDLGDLWQFDLRPAPALCAAYGKALAATFGPERYRGSAYLNLLAGQYPNMEWLRGSGCDLDGAVGAVDARLESMLESKDSSGAAANDYAAYYSRFGVGRETVEAARTTLAGFHSR